MRVVTRTAQSDQTRAVTANSVQVWRWLEKPECRQMNSTPDCRSQERYPSAHTRNYGSDRRRGRGILDRYTRLGVEDSHRKFHRPAETGRRWLAKRGSRSRLRGSVMP